MNFESYVREGVTVYANFAEVVASILRAALEREGGYRLQQVRARAKQPASLQKKLEQRGKTGTATLESEIKDLAGCRVIFYTNGDVARFTGRGIVHQNFDVIEVKVHYPDAHVENAHSLYVSNHYVVRLRSDRTALPEYARFNDLRCEIQVQTILDHAWSEMEHDIIYKAPALENFGGALFEAIKGRLGKVARKYLLPAGHEFQKIATDFQRLIDGKELFDENALDAIVKATDNNERSEAIERFSEYVLPHYDDLSSVYLDIVAKLLDAADKACTTPPIAIQAPNGQLPAKTYGNIVSAIAGILNRCRYLNVPATFDAICRIYARSDTEDVRKPLIEVAEEMAKHNMRAWQQLHGPAVQSDLVELISALGDEELRALQPLLTTVLRAVLGTEVTGTTWANHKTLMFHRGAVVASEALRKVRTKAIELLKRQFTLASAEKERAAILSAFQTATQPAVGVGYDNDLALMVMEDTAAVVHFQAEILAKLSHGLRQKIEHRVHSCYWRYAELPPLMCDDERLVAAQRGVCAVALKFSSAVNSDEEFVYFKTLVGFESIFLPAWRQRDFSYEEAKEYRQAQVVALVESVSTVNAETWFDRINNYARVESDDLATFPVFGSFLTQLAEAQPAVVSGYVDRMDVHLANFLPPMLDGLLRSSSRTAVLAQIEAWIEAGAYLGQIAWHLRFADPFDESLLRRVLDSSVQRDNMQAVRNVLIAAVHQFPKHPGTLIDNVFIPAVHAMTAKGDFGWIRMPVFSWLEKPIIRALDETQAMVVLNALVSYPDLTDGAEYITASIARRWPEKVVAFIGARQELRRGEHAAQDYDAVPFVVHQLREPLAAAPDSLIAGAQAWFNADRQRFSYNGARLLSAVFPDLSGGLDVRLDAMIDEGGDGNLAFVLAVLEAFEGKPYVYDRVRAIVAKLDVGSPLLEDAELVLLASGVVSGEFGFVALYKERRALLEAWQADASEAVRTFADEEIRNLDRRIAAETRSAEAGVAQRRLEAGEDLHGGEGRDR